MFQTLITCRPTSAGASQLTFSISRGTPTHTHTYTCTHAHNSANYPPFSNTHVIFPEHQSHYIRPLLTNDYSKDNIQTPYLEKHSSISPASCLFFTSSALAIPSHSIPYPCPLVKNTLWPPVKRSYSEAPSSPSFFLSLKMHLFSHLHLDPTLPHALDKPLGTDSESAQDDLLRHLGWSFLDPSPPPSIPPTAPATTESHSHILYPLNPLLHLHSEVIILSGLLFVYSSSNFYATKEDVNIYLYI